MKDILIMRDYTINKFDAINDLPLLLPKNNVMILK